MKNLITFLGCIFFSLKLYAENLKIDTNTPAKELDVVGDIKFSGDLYQNEILYKPNNLSINDLIDGKTSSTSVSLGENAGTSTTGLYNTTVGNRTLFTNTNGHSNRSNDYRSLYNNITGGLNTAIGRNTFSINTIGNRNVALGFNANVSADNLTNTIIIGASAVVDASNKIRMGNSSITAAYIQVACNITSDRRWKEDIKDLDLGLIFLNDLVPVSYIRINNDSEKREFGLIAQHLENTIKKHGFDPSGLGFIIKDKNGYYPVRYNDFIPILIKSLLEISADCDNLKKDSAMQKLHTKNLEAQLTKLQDQNTFMITELIHLKELLKTHSDLCKSSVSL